MMKNQQRIVYILAAILLSFSSLVLVVSSSHLNTGALSKEDMEIYAQAFLESYDKELKDNFRPQVRKYFPFYSDHLYYINATISSVHGAALEFIPWDREVYEFETINSQLEPAIFKYVNLGITRVNNSAGYKVIISHGLSPFGAFITIRSHAHVFFANIIFVTNEACYIDVKEGGELFLSNVIVDEKHFHTLIMRGSNEPNNWTIAQAKIDAHRFFEEHLYRAFNQSEEFREYLAIPELSQLLEPIIWKHLHEEEYDLIAFKEDLAKVRELARDKYHLNTEFVDELLDYLEKKAMTPSPPPPWEVAPWSWILAGLVGVALTAIAAKVYKRLKPARKKLMKKKRSRRKKMGVHILNPGDRNGHQQY